MLLLDKDPQETITMVAYLVVFHWMECLHSFSLSLFPLLFDYQIKYQQLIHPNPFHFCIAGFVAVAMSCVLLLDESQKEETQECIQCIAATMSMIIATTQESTRDSEFDNED